MMEEAEMATRCPPCGREGLADGIRELSRTFGGRKYVGTVPAQVCPHCGEGLVSYQALGRFEAAVSRALIASGASDGATLKWLRKVAGVTGAELAELLGVTSKTVSRWETGESLIDRAALSTLGRLAEESGEGRTDTADQLRAMASPTKQPRTVVLGAVG